MNVVMKEAAVELRVPQARRSSSQSVLHGVLFVVTVAIVVIGLRTHVPNGITAVNAVAFGLTLVWAVAAVVANRFSGRTAAGPDPYALLIAADSLLAAVALTAGRLGQHESLHSFGAAKSVATIAALLVTAVSFHFLLALPDGQLPGKARRTAVVVAYVAALATGVALVIDEHALSILGGGISWSIAALAAVIPLRLRYAERGRARSGASPMVRHRRGSRQRHRIGHGRAACAHQLARPSGRSGGGEHGAGADLPHGERVPETGSTERAHARPFVHRLRIRGHGVGDLPDRRARIGPQAGHGDRPHDIGALDAGDRHRRLGVRPGPRALRGLGHPIRLRRQAGARRGPSDLRQPADTGHTDGRAPAAAGRIPPQDHGAGERGGLHRHGRSPGEGRFRSRFGPALPRRDES